jgi:hypothetical protein
MSPITFHPHFLRLSVFLGIFSNLGVPSLYMGWHGGLDETLHMMHAELTR